MRTAKTLIRLGGYPGWSESSLGAHSFCWFCHVAAHIAPPPSPPAVIYMHQSVSERHYYWCPLIHHSVKGLPFRISSTTVQQELIFTGYISWVLFRFEDQYICTSSDKTHPYGRCRSCSRWVDDRQVVKHRNIRWIVLHCNYLYWKVFCP